MESAEKKRLVRILVPVAAGSLLIVTLVLLFNSLREYHYREILSQLRGYSRAVLLTAAGITALSFLELTLYDVLALRYIGAKLPYRKTAFASFLSYVFSFNVGMSILGSSAVRMRFYSLWGLDGERIARMVAFCIATFWVGLAAAGGVALIIAPAPALSGFALSARVLGILLLAAAAVYFAASASGKAAISFRKFSIALPSGKIAVAQIIVAALDWCLAAYVLYVLLPDGRPPFSRFLSMYIIAQLAAATSHVPGGVGVLETVIMFSLSSYIQPGPLFGTLLAYRGIYYLMPLAVAIIAFTVHEAWAGRKKAAGFVAAAARLAAPVVPTLIAVAVFIAGAVLLFSAATPALAGRLKLFDELFPLAVLEMSHFSASLVGLALLFVADALRRRVDAAYYIALGLLAAGTGLSVLKGFEWEQAGLLIVVMALLIPSRRHFQRRAVLLAKPTSPWWVVAVGTVLIVSVWLGFFAYKHVQYSNELWWQFELARDAPRFLRAGLGVAIAAGIVALRILLMPRPNFPKETLQDCGADVRRILASAKAANSNLALLGDKLFHFSPSRNAFVMYALSGRTCVVMGNPIGDSGEFTDLLWDFHELAQRQGARVVWYEITADHLPVFLELGLKVLKIGEEAVVDLAEFTLAGSRGKRLRPPCNKMEKDGYQFSVLDPEEARSVFGQLKTISDEWMTEKKAREKGFSLGYFDESYLANFSCAVVRREDRIVAFANLWASGSRDEISVDLMRHAKDAPNGTMEYLFVRSIEWAKTNGYRRFTLGIAPFSGVEHREAAPLWNKAIALIFKTGEGIYNFQGLRAFKSKFLPNWEPRYIAFGANTPTAAAVADVVFLISKSKKESQE